MGYGSIVNADATILSPAYELNSCKGSAEIFNYPIRHTEPVHNVLHEFDYLCSIELDEWLVLYPLSKLINSYVDVLETTRCSFEGSNHVKPPA